MNPTGLRLTLAVALAAALAGCGGDDVVGKPPAAPAIETFVARGGADAEGRAWDGTVEAVREAVLSAQTGGRVTAVDVDVNDRVVAGQVLLRLTVVEQQAGVDAARAQLRAAEAAAVEAERQYQRFASLARDKYVSGAQLDQARAGRDAANAARDAARAQVSAAGQNADYTTVRAPYAGIVAARRVEPGETVGPGQPLLTVYAPDDLRIEVRVPQSAADAIRAKPQAQVVFDDGRRVEAREVVVYPAADPASHSVPVRVALPRIETGAPAPGATAKVVFPIAGGERADRRDGGVRIPYAAVARRGELTAVYVVKDGRVLLRQVRLGARNGDAVDVLAGLTPGEVVARDPAEALRMLAAARVAQGGLND
ncbi:efflux RND transporter periplasmic adaptor subunit [Lysobacter brunescens]|uniref:Efflux RND transporter periplasmic adaptor subunit n=1 Tax=Lysobacter brunescens TaxID=262323 RepID=A0ABW2YC43_9GAMM